MATPVFPAVGVVIPAFRCAQTIGQVLNALLAQTVRPRQIVVVNDSSPDRLAEVLSAYGDSIEVVTNPTNCGLAKSYNIGLRRLQTDYAMTLHSDCVLEPDYVRNLLGILEGDLAIAVAMGEYRFPDVERMAFTDRLFLALNLIPRKQDVTGTRRVSFIEGKADVFRTSCLKEVGFFDERFILTAEDQDLSARLRAHGWHLVQDTCSHFTSAFGGTQDTVRKVMRKQRTYARGQAFIAVKYGRKAYESTTSNRNLRAWHRFSQLLFAGVGLALLAGWPWSPVFAWAWGGWVVMRYAIYLALCAWVGWRAIWGVALLGLWSDVWYAVGFAEGLLKVLIWGRT